MSFKFRPIDKTLNLLGVARVIGHGRWLGGVHLPASVVSPGHRKQVNTSVYRWFFLNVEHVDCWATDVYCNCTSCQSCSRHSRWLPTLLQCPTKPEFKWKMRCLRKKEATNSAVYLSSEKLDSVGMLQPKGRSEGSEQQNCFTFSKVAVTSQKPLQVPARVFSGGSTLPSWNYMVGLRPPVAHRLWASERDESTCIQDCRRGRSSAWPSPSWRAAEPPGILLSKP